MNDLQGLLMPVLNEFLEILPRIVGGLLIILVGLKLVQIARSGLQQVLEKMNISHVFKKTPVEHFLKSIGPHSIESGISAVVYWLLVLVVFQTGVSVLGLNTLTDIFDSVLSYLPHVVSALIVLLIGVGVAGFVETFVKRALVGLDVHTSRVAGRMSSYVVVALAAMIAISEMGIARDYILIMFVGFVSSVSLAVGLAFGLGAKGTISKLLESWYTRRHNSSDEEKPKRK